MYILYSSDFRTVFVLLYLIKRAWAMELQNLTWKKYRMQMTLCQVPFRFKWLGVMKWAGIPGCVLTESKRSRRSCWWHKLIWASYFAYNGSISTGFCFTLAKSSLLQVNLPHFQDQVRVTYFVVSREYILPSALRPFIFICVIMWIISVSLQKCKNVIFLLHIVSPVLSTASCLRLLLKR